MAVQWDKDKGLNGWGINLWNTIRGIKKDLPEVNEEIRKFIETNSKFFEGVNAQDAEILRSVIVQDAEELSNVTDELKGDFASFLETADLSGDILKQYQVHLKKTGKEFTDLSSFTKKAGSALKSFGAALGSMAVNWLIGKAIDLVATGIDKFGNASKHAAESAQELASEMNDSISSITSNSSTLSELNDEYQKLSQGVNKLGENVSLSTEDYSRYKDIISQVSTIMPDLNTYFNAQGEKIAFAKGELQDLNEEYEEYIHNQAIKYVSKGDSDGHKIQDILDNYNNNESLSGLEKFWNEIEYLMLLPADINDFTTRDILNELYKLKSSESIDELKEKLKWRKWHFSLSNHDQALTRSVVNELGITTKEINSMTEADYNAFMQSITSLIQTYEAKITSDMSQVRTALLQETYSKDAYWQIEDEDIRNDIVTFLSSIDSNIWDELNIKTDNDLSTFINKIINSMSENEDGFNDAWNGLFNPKLEDLPVNEYVQQIDNFLKTICGVLELDEIDGIPILKFSLGFEDIDTLASNYQTVIGSAAEKFSGDSIITSPIGGKIFGPAYFDEVEALENFAKENSINTQEEVAFFKQCIEESDTREEAMEKYLASSRGKGEPPIPLSITETVNQINTQLKSAFDSLQSAYQDIFTLDEDTGEKLFSLDDVDISTFEAIRSELEKLDSLDGINVDYSRFEDFVSVLIDTSSTAEEVQEQFNKLATDIIYTSDCTNMSAETFDLLAKSLSEMGITNEYEVLNSILELQKSLAAEGIHVKTAMSGEVEALKNLTFESEETAEHLMAYYVQKQLTENPISTLEDILQLESLCKALGITGEMYDAVNGLKSAFESKENGNHSEGIEKSIQYYQQKLSDLASGYGSFQFDFEGIGSSGAGSSSSSSAKNTIETFDWIEQAIENVEKEVEELDEIANSSYSTFSEKNEALAQEISKVSEEIGLQQQAYDEYMHKADSVALPDHYKQLVQSGAINIEDISDENLQDLISEYQNWYDKAQDVSDAIKQLKTDMKDLYVSAYELQTSNLKDRLDSDSITEKQYLDSLKEAYEKFYADLDDFAEQYHEAVLDYLAEEKDYLNSVAGAAASLIDTEIDNIQDDAKLQEDSIQRQIDLLEAKKKPLQDELDALEDKAKKENLILNLQKAQYDLARAENQKTKLVYTSKGMTYTADPTAIKDAQKGVDDAKLEIRKQSIQDQIDALDDEIDRYHDLIDQINKAADNQIDALEKIKNKWQEVIDQQEYTKNVSLLTGEFGTSAITKLLTGNDDALLAQWKNSYINTLSSLDMENQGYISDMTSLMASLYGVNLSPVQEQFRNVNDSINGMTASLGRAASAIGSGISVPAYNNADAENNTSPTNLTDSITGVRIAADQSLPGVSYNMDDIADTAANAALEVSTVANAIDNIPEYKDVTISIHTVGGNVSSGMSPNVPQIAYTDNAYADGTDTAERITTRSGATLRPLQPGDKMYDLVQKFDTYMSSMGNKVEAVAQNAAYEQSRQMNEAARQITNSNIINNHNQPGVMVGDVHITCPGVTSQEVAKQVGTELNNIFSGLSLKAYQMANITR